MYANESLPFTFMDRKYKCKYVCFTRRRSEHFAVCLTDGEHVWAKDYSDEELKEFMKKHSMKSTEEYIQRLRVSCGEGCVSVCVSDAAEIHLGRSEADPSERLPAADELRSKQELKELLFNMADHLTSKYETRPAVPERMDTDFQPQKQNKPPSLKRRRHGTSLINPGTPKKPDATGVAFNDGDDED